LQKYAYLFLSLSILSCGNDDNEPKPDAGGSDFGKVTSTVIIVNPVINEGSTTTVAPGNQRSGVVIQAGNLPAVETDATGLAVVKNIPTGSVPVKLSNGTVNLNVVAEKELYDMVLSYNANGTAEIIPAIRYSIGGTVVRVNNASDLINALKTDNAIVFLEPGVYDGNFEITAAGVLLFGSWDPIEGSLSTINGNLTVKGGGARMRGVAVSGTLTVNANGYSAAFCEFNNASITGNSVSLLRNVFTGSNVTVPSSSAVLVDNQY
jgi:hypothetical protein